MIHLHNICQSYNGATPILDQLNGVIRPNQRVSIMGPSGSGKSTLLRIIAGLTRPSSGRVTIHNHDLYALNDTQRSQLRRREFGFVFQSFRLFSSLTALDNVALVLTMVEHPDPYDEAARWLDRVALHDRAHHYPDQLSGGECQRVAIARALATAPRCVIADEPTGNLDQDTSRLIQTLLFECLDDTGASLLLVTHDPTLAAQCPHRYELTNGQLVATASP